MFPEPGSLQLPGFRFPYVCGQIDFMKERLLRPQSMMGHSRPKQETYTQQVP
jgi:hypothetical protein